jgi:hypothetical protein
VLRLGEGALEQPGHRLQRAEGWEGGGQGRAAAGSNSMGEVGGRVQVQGRECGGRGRVKKRETFALKAMMKGSGVEMRGGGSWRVRVAARRATRASERQGQGQGQTPLLIGKKAEQGCKILL